MRQESTFKRLRGFANLAEAGSFNKAAQRMGISQPALSYHISKLEEQLSTKLFERSATGVILTPEGRTALALAREVLDALASLESLSTRGDTAMLDEIRLGASPTLGPYILPNVLQKLHELFPTLRVNLQDAAPSVLLEGLLSGRHDIVFAQLPLRSDKIEVERLFREPLKLVLPKAHPLAEKPEVTDEDLKGQQVLSLSNAFTLHAQLSALCDEVGATLRAEYEGTSLDALRNMTAIEMGVTFLPALYVRSEVTSSESSVTVRRFRNDRFTRSIGLARRKSSGRNAVLSQLSGIIRDVVRTEYAGITVLEGQ
ncbi:MAG: hydrogen peroxide-inducible genes activator [Pseudomonadota bacterium]